MALTLHGTVSDNTVALDRKTATPLIINGDMAIAQRGTSTSSITNGNYRTLDRFYTNNNNVGSVTNSQSTDVPTGQGFATSFKIAVDTSDTPSGTEWLQCQYRTEAQDLKPLKFNTSSAEGFTISFWVKSAKTGTYTLAILNDNASRSISQTYTISSANTWEKKVLSFAGDTAGAIPNNNTIGLILYWILASGGDRTSGTFQTSWDSYVTADFISSSQVNLADSTSNDWYITGVQLEVGTYDAYSIPPFQFEDVGTSLTRCHRYFYKSVSNAPYSVLTNGFETSTTKFLGRMDFPTEMRALPTMSSGGSFQVIDGSSRSVSAVAFDGNSRSLNGARVDVTISGGTTGKGAMLRASNDTDAFLEADAEL
jgi:hypothetical protein